MTSRTVRSGVKSACQNAVDELFSNADDARAPPGVRTNKTVAVRILLRVLDTRSSVLRWKNYTNHKFGRVARNKILCASHKSIELVQEAY